MKRILFLTANPSHQEPLNLMKEFQQLQDAVQATLPTDLFVLEWRFAARPEQVPAYLAECQPDIVHFAGHGSRAGGLILEDDEGRDVVVSVDRLGRVLSDLPHPPECIILNACYSATQARQLLTTVRHVIAMDDAIADESAIQFTRAFYRALSRQQTIPEAVVTARRAIDLLALPGDRVPVHFQQDAFRDYLLDLERDLRALWDETVAVPLDVHVEALATLTRPPAATLLADYVREEAVGTGAAWSEGLSPQTPRVFASLGEAFAALDGRVLVLGEPGSGKSVALQALTLALIRRRLDDGLAPLPFFKPLRYWNPEWTTAEPDEPLPDLADWLSQDLARYGLKAEAAQHIRSGRAVLVLDGLDELGVWHRDSPRKALPNGPLGTPSTSAPGGEAEVEGGYDPRVLWLRCFDAQFRSATSVAIGCRHEVFESPSKTPLAIPSGLSVVQLKPLTPDQIRDYLQDSSELWEAMVEERDLFDVARSPLLLRLITVSYSELHQEPQAVPEQSAGALRYVIFARYVDGTYQREQRKNAGRPLPFTLDEILEGLGRLAMDKVVRGEAQGPTTLSTSDFPGHWALERREAFLALATRLSLLMPEPERPGTFRMVHGLLQNYLAYQYAVRLAGELQDDAPSPDVHAAVTCVLALADLSSVDLLLEWVPRLFGRSAYAEDRRQIVTVLGRLHDDRARVLLQECLLDDDEGVQIAAAHALASFPDPSTVRALVDALDVWPTPNLLRALADSLGILQASEAVDPLVRLLTDGRMGDEDDLPIDAYQAARAVAAALKAIGAPSRDALLQAVAVPHGQEVRRFLFTAWLAVRDTDHGSEDLLAFLESPNADIRQWVIDDLGERDEEPGLRDALLDWYRREEDASVRAAVCTTLAAWPVEHQTLDLFVEALRDPDSVVSAAALDGLKAAGFMGREAAKQAWSDDADPEWLSRLLVVLSAEPDPATAAFLRAALARVTERPSSESTLRARLILALGYQAMAEDGPFLRQGLDASDAEVRAATLEALGYIADRESIQALLHGLEQPDLADAAVRGLVHVGEPLLEVLAARPEPLGLAARRALPELLVHCGHRAKPWFARLLSDPDRDVLERTLQSLQGIDPDELPVLPLVAVLKRSTVEESLRSLAVATLGRSPAPAALDALFQAAFEAPEATRLATWRVLQKKDCLQDDRLQPALRQGLQATLIELRVLAAESLLREPPDPAAIETLVGLLRDDAVDDDIERGRIFDILGNWVERSGLPHEHALRHFCEALNDFITASSEKDVSQREALFRVTLAKLSASIDADPALWYGYKWRAEILGSWLPAPTTAELTQAVADIHRVLEQRPRMAPAVRQLAELHHSLRDYPQARDVYHRYIELRGGPSFDTHAWLSMLEYAAGEYRAAVKWCTAALVLRDEDAICRKRRAWAYETLGCFDEALVDVMTLISQRQDGSDYALRARIHVHQGRADDARAAACRAEELGDETLSRYWSGLAFIRDGRFAEALVEFESVLSHTEDVESYRYWRGLALIGLGRFAEAEADLMTRQGIDRPDGGIALAYIPVWRGVMDRLQGHETQALRALYEAQELGRALATPDHRHRILAITHLLLDRPADARAAYQAVLAANPDRDDLGGVAVYPFMLVHLFPNSVVTADLARWLHAELQQRAPACDELDR